MLMRGQDAVIAAETGSGKTLSYIAPIASHLLRQKLKQADNPRPLHWHALVLCPNGPLCQQVASVINGLKGADGQPLLTAVQVRLSNDCCKVMAAAVQ